MAVTTLEVRLGRRTVGTLRPASDVDRLSFVYASAWLADPTAFPVSLSLPLREAPYDGGAGHSFFANLLPEGGARRAVCDRLGISVDNDIALLRAIGGECAGALSIVPPEQSPPDPEHYRYETLSDARLQRLVDDRGEVPLLLGGAGTRLSLAGAQDKLPVAVLDGRIQLPHDLAPSTHILKLPSKQYAHLTVNEAFVLGLAARVGLEVVDAELLHRTDPPALLVERYDRRRSEDDWPAIRLHQEDLCQAIGLPAVRKYEQEGGPTFAGSVELVRSNVEQPVIDVRRLLEWQVFNVVAGNSDGHGKNLSILYQPGGAIRLAPFYDLISTRHYPGIQRLLAMAVGGRRDPDELGAAEWTQLAKDLGVGERLVLGIVRQVAEHCADAVQPWAAEFRAEHGEQPILQTLPRAIARRSRKTLTAASATTTGERRPPRKRT